MTKYAVTFYGGSIGSKGSIPKEFDTREEALDYRRRMNSLLTKCEKEYYHCKYKMKTIKEKM